MDNCFECLIPDVPLSAYEKYAVGITTGGAGRQAFRQAWCKKEENDMIISGRTDIVAGDSDVIVARIGLDNIEKINYQIISKGDQRKIALRRSLGWGGGFAIAIAVAVFIGAGKTAKLEYIPEALFVLLFMSMTMTLLFSYIPAVLKIKSALTIVHFSIKGGGFIAIALLPQQINAAKQYLNNWLRGVIYNSAESSKSFESDSSITQILGIQTWKCDCGTTNLRDSIACRNCGKARGNKSIP